MGCASEPFLKRFVIPPSWTAITSSIAMSTWVPSPVPPGPSRPHSAAITPFAAIIPAETSAICAPAPTPGLSL